MTGILQTDYVGRIVMYDAQTGEPLWSTTVGMPNLSVPTITDAAVIIADFHGVLYLLDKRTGKVRWRNDLGMRAVNGLPVLSDGTRVYAHGYSRQGKRDLNIAALSLRDGSRQWDVAIPTWTSSVVEPGEERILIGTKEGELIILDSRNGKIISTRQLMDGPILRLARHDDRLTVIGRGRLASFKWPELRAIWSNGFQVYSPFFYPFEPWMIVPGKQFLGLTDDSRMLSYSLDDGDPQWSAPIEAGDLPPAFELAGPFVIYASGDNPMKLHWLNRETGNEVHSTEIRGGRMINRPLFDSWSGVVFGGTQTSVFAAEIPVNLRPTRPERKRQ